MSQLWSDLSLTALDGSPFDASALEGRAVLVVNVASRCGFTRQYEGLQALHAARAEAGLVVMGVPCNQFGGQEPGSAEDIASLCRTTYGVGFPILEKQEVNGAGRSPLYARLIESEIGGGADIRWNFEKFVVDRSGTVVARFGSRTTPRSSAMAEALDMALASG